MPGHDVWTVGDSLTFGAGWPGATPGGWRALVADELPGLRWRGSSAQNPAPGRAADRHDGHPGWRVDEIAALSPPSPAPGLVLAQGGSNDLIGRYAPGRGFDGSYDEFADGQRAEFGADLAGRLAGWWRNLSADGATLVVWTVPPFGRGGPLYASPTLIDVNVLLRKQVVPELHAAGIDVHLVDVQTALAPDGIVTPGLLGQDGVHPTLEGYRVIARAVTEVLRPLLGC